MRGRQKGQTKKISTIKDSSIYPYEIQMDEDQFILIDTKKNKENFLKELCELVYVCVGFADTYGWNFDVAFNRVHSSNMSKLNKNGDPIFREDGKIMKSNLYKEPDLQDLV